VVDRELELKPQEQGTSRRELVASIELQVGTYSCSMYGVPYNFFRKAYNGML